MLLFISIFFGVNFLANLYIFSRLFAFFQWRWGWLLWALVFAFSISYIAAAFIDRIDGFFFSRWLLRAAGFWLGAGLILLMALAVHDIARLVIPVPLNISRWIALGAAGALVLYAVVNAQFVQVVEIAVPGPTDKTIVHLSDVHVGSVTRRHLRRLVHMTKRIKPDIVVITGDLMDSSSGLSDRSFESLKELDAPIYFVIGNHERYEGLDKVMDFVSRTPMIALRNEMTEWQGIQIIGIDDSDHPDRVETRLRQFNPDPDKYSILLYHRPTGFEAAAEKGIDLMLSGHTHNGQIWPFNYVVRTHFPRMKGLHTIGDSRLFVSSGSGTWGPPMRLGSRSQIVVIRLQSTPQSN